MGGIIFGFPIVGYCLQALVIYRCGAPRWYRNVNGLSCFEAFARSFYCLFCCKRFHTENPSNTDDGEDGVTNKLAGKIFCCCPKKKEEKAVVDVSG